MTDEPLKIKKYANRRLYDTQQSRYITLAELAAIVRQGRSVHVVDAKTDEDLTRQVLVQVILEEQDRLDLLPVDLLHQVIRVQGTFRAGALSSALSESMTRFWESSEALKEQVDEAFEGVASAAREGARMWMGAVEGMFRDWTVPGATTQAGTRAGGAATGARPPSEPGASKGSAGPGPASTPAGVPAEGPPPEGAPEPEEKPDLARDVEDLKRKMATLLDILSGKS